MKTAELKSIILELISEALWGHRLKVVIGRKPHPALISKNLAHKERDEAEYRLSWFNPETMAPMGHVDFPDFVKDYILQYKKIPMPLRIKLFKRNLPMGNLIFEMKRTGPIHLTGADILVGTIDPNDGWVEAKWGGTHATLNIRNNRRGNFRFNDESRNVYWQEAHPRIYQNYVDKYIEDIYGFVPSKHITLDDYRSDPIAYEWFYNDARGMEQKEKS